MLVYVMFFCFFNGVVVVLALVLCWFSYCVGKGAWGVWGCVEGYCVIQGPV